MEKVEFLIVGAGVTGLAFANFLPKGRDWLCLERNEEPGGYCRTVKQDGFVWDYSGHFFHFRDPETEQFLLERMSPDNAIRVVQKRSSILYGGTKIDFPFQKNIHQLPKSEFLECLCDLYFREEGREPESFLDMLYLKFGKAITEKFLKPYNEKLYACSLDLLDQDAMGRFFPYADFESVMQNIRSPDSDSYNASFTYPSGGAMEYVKALLFDLDHSRVQLGEEVTRVDPENRIARTRGGREIAFEHLISAVPFPRLLGMTGMDFDAKLYTYNKVLVFNLGFDAGSQVEDHWIYIPDPSIRFYRVGFYDNIFDSDRMSLYVEIGLKPEDAVNLDEELSAVLDGLRRLGIVTEQRLVSYHAVVLDPAYVHVHGASQQDYKSKSEWLANHRIYSAGRYGAWKYCSIEDNILEAKELASRISRSS